MTSTADKNEGIAFYGNALVAFTDEKLYDTWKPEDWYKNIQRFFDPNGDDKLFIFVSFDICGSTKLKYEVPEWREIVDTFLQKQPDGIPMRILKTIGDETVFFNPVNSLINICDTIMVANGHCIDLHEEFLRITKNRKKIFVKATVWIACVSQKANANNIVVRTTDTFAVPDSTKHIHIFRPDFSGKNIDEGFRLSENAEQNMVIVDPKIVMALALANELINNQKSEYSLGFDIPENFTKSIHSFMEQGKNSEVGQKILNDSKARFEQCRDSVFNSGFARLSGVKGGCGYLYPIFKHFDKSKELVANFPYIRAQYVEFDKKCLPSIDADTFKMLNRNFMRPGHDVRKTMREILRLLKFDSIST